MESRKIFSNDGPEHSVSVRRGNVNEFLIPRMVAGIKEQIHI
jgi:hypothetical protein